MGFDFQIFILLIYLSPNLLILLTFAIPVLFSSFFKKKSIYIFIDFREGGRWKLQW